MNIHLGYEVGRVREKLLDAIGWIVCKLPHRCLLCDTWLWEEKLTCADCRKRYTLTFE